MRLALALAVASFASAASMPVGYFHGTLVRFDGTPAQGGTLAATTVDGQTLDCHYDKKTFVQLENWHVQIDKLTAGDYLEVLADHRLLAGNAMPVCYMLSIAVVPPPAPPGRPGRKTATPVKDPVKDTKAYLLRRALDRHLTQSFSGVVTRVTKDFLTIRTHDGLETFRLRPDTRILGNGTFVGVEDVKMNQRLAVEASPNGDNQLEAYQVMWGTLSVQPE